MASRKMKKFSRGQSKAECVVLEPKVFMYHGWTVNFRQTFAALLLSLVLFQASPGWTEPPRNVILMIGDGMGPQQVGLITLYAHMLRERGDPVAHAGALEALLDRGTMGVMQPKPHGALVTDSACASTQIAAGVDSLPNMLGLDAEGQPIVTVIDGARALGKSQGLVSDTRITHATPAGFFAKALQRDDENAIAEQAVSSGVDVMFSGGLRHFIPKNASSDSLKQYGLTDSQVRTVRSTREDDKDLLREARARGYEVLLSPEHLIETSGAKVLGLFANSAMESALSGKQRAKGFQATEPNLRQMSVRALELLDQNPKGFFLMIEGGQIDWAGHANDAGWLLQEMLRFSEALDGVLKWMEGRTDTLLIVTADHETGSFGFSFHAEGIPTPRAVSKKSKLLFAPTFNFVPESVLDNLAKQDRRLEDISWEASRKDGVDLDKKQALQALVKKHLGFEISLDEAGKALLTEDNQFYVPGHGNLGEKVVPMISDFDAFYARPRDRRSAALARSLATKSGVTWGTGAHTSTPVYVIALGPSEEKFKGAHTAPELGRLLKGLF